MHDVCCSILDGFARQHTHVLSKNFYYIPKWETFLKEEKRRQNGIRFGSNDIS